MEDHDESLPLYVSNNETVPDIPNVIISSITANFQPHHSWSIA